MQFKPSEEAPGQPRYDAETLRQVTVLAQQLQESHRAGLTARQIEEIGEEVGLGRAFVREALRQLAIRNTAHLSRDHRPPELGSLLTGGALGAFWILLAWACAAAGAGTASFLILSAAPLLAGAIGAAIGWQRAAKGKDGYAEGNVSSPALLGLLVTVQRQLAERARRCAFLGVEIAGLRELRRDASEAAVASSLGQLHEWIEGLVGRAGGECHGSIDQGLICTFTSDRAAVSVARELQEGIGRFNTEHNRAAAPLRLRCGIHAGVVATDGPLPALQTALIERAIELQRQSEPGDILVSGEVTTAALVELRSLAPLGLEAGTAPVFSWQAGLRARQRP